MNVYCEVIVLSACVHYFTMGITKLYENRKASEALSDR